MTPSSGPVRSGAAGPALAAGATVMLVTGADKAEPLRAVLSEAYDPLRLPAQIGPASGPGVVWFLDQEAARLLPTA